MPDATPYLDPADVETCYVNAAVTGCRFVTIAGAKVDGLTQVRPAAAGEEPYGVAMRDAATGAKVGVAKMGVWPVMTGAALSAGNRVQSGAAGVAILLAAGRPAGLIVDDVGNAVIGPVDINRGR